MKRCECLTEERSRRFAQLRKIRVIRLRIFCLMLVLSQLCGRLRLTDFHDVAEMSYKTKTGEGGYRRDG